MTAYEIPAAGSAEVFALRNGHVGLGGNDGADRVALVASRELLLSLADMNIPGHGAPLRARESA